MARIGTEDFDDAMRRITQCAQTVVDRMGTGELAAPRVDQARAERAVGRHLRVRGYPSLPQRWLFGCRAARDYIRAREPREPRAAYWPAISIAPALDAAWFAGAARPPIRTHMNWIAACSDWDDWVAAVEAANDELAGNPDFVAPAELFPPDQAHLEAPSSQCGRDAGAEDGWRGAHPLRRWLPLIDAFAAGLYFYWVGRDEVVCIARPALWIIDGRLHREDGPAVMWPNGEHHFFRDGEEILASEDA